MTGWLKRAIVVGASAGGIVFLGAATAVATEPDGGDIASDDTTVIEVADGSPVVQVGVCGNAVGIAGDAWASCSGDQDAETSGPETTVGDEDQGGQKPHDVGGDIRAVDDGKGGAADDFAAVQ